MNSAERLNFRHVDKEEGAHLYVVGAERDNRGAAPKREQFASPLSCFFCWPMSTLLEAGRRFVSQQAGGAMCQRTLSGGRQRGEMLWMNSRRGQTGAGCQ